MEASQTGKKAWLLDRAVVYIRVSEGKPRGRFIPSPRRPAPRMRHPGRSPRNGAALDPRRRGHGGVPGPDGRVAQECDLHEPGWRVSLPPTDSKLSQTGAVPIAGSPGPRFLICCKQQPSRAAARKRSPRSVVGRCPRAQIVRSQTLFLQWRGVVRKQGQTELGSCGLICAALTGPDKTSFHCGTVLKTAKHLPIYSGSQWFCQGL
jgi:hypothetical protein